jgi:hypothetical protein
MSYDWETRRCPNCLSASKSKPEVFAENRAENLSFEEVREFFIGIRHEQIFFSYSRCRECGLLFCPRYFTDTQLDTLYSDMPDNLLGAEKSTAAKTQVGYFRYFQKRIGKVEKYLELGPDIGLVTNEVISYFKPQNSYLVEPNTAMHQTLRQLSHQSNIAVYRNLQDVELSEIDLTIGIHVFDHLLVPSSQINSIFKQTKPGGILGVVVHNESSLLRRLLGKKWPPFCLQHPQLFNKRTLEKIMLNSGFELVKISNSVNYFNLKHLGTLAIEILHLPKILIRILPSVELPVVLGNQISVFRKPA